jgi:hypothetical protein
MACEVDSLKKDFLVLFIYDIQHCFICHPSYSTVSEDAGIEPRTVATTVLAVRHSNHSARSHPLDTSGTLIVYVHVCWSGAF